MVFLTICSILPGSMTRGRPDRDASSSPLIPCFRKRRCQRATVLGQELKAHWGQELKAHWGQELKAHCRTTPTCSAISLVVLPAATSRMIFARSTVRTARLRLREQRSSSHSCSQLNWIFVAHGIPVCILEQKGCLHPSRVDLHTFLLLSREICIRHARDFVQQRKHWADGELQRRGVLQHF